MYNKKVLLERFDIEEKIIDTDICVLNCIQTHLRENNWNVVII